jgi:hypothetical protein
VSFGLDLRYDPIVDKKDGSIRPGFFGQVGPERGVDGNQRVGGHQTVTDSRDKAIKVPQPGLDNRCERTGELGRWARLSPTS